MKETMSYAIALRRMALAGSFALATGLVPGAVLAQVETPELVIVQGSNPPSLDAMTTSSQASRNINMNIYETLYGFSDAIKPIPILAEGVKISDDPPSGGVPGVRDAMMGRCATPSTTRRRRPVASSPSAAPTIWSPT